MIRIDSDKKNLYVDKATPDSNYQHFVFNVMNPIFRWLVCGHVEHELIIYGTAGYIFQDISRPESQKLAGYTSGWAGFLYSKGKERIFEIGKTGNIHIG
jgi:hypothetical protein